MDALTSIRAFIYGMLYFATLGTISLVIDPVDVPEEYINDEDWY